MSGRIPESFIDELMARVDIVDVIESRVPLRKQGGEYAALCPFHNEKTPSFTVSPAKQFYHCFGCGAHGTAIGFLMDYEHLEFVEAVEELAGRVGLEVPREAGRAPATEANAGLYETLAAAARYYKEQLRRHPAAQRAIDYLKDRGLTGEIVRDFGIGYAPPGWDNLLRHMGGAARERLAQAGLAIERQGGAYDRFRDRVIFPIRDRRGRVIAFGGRVLDDGTPKYLNSPETPIFHKGRELYGLYEARTRERRLEGLLVVEGYMDVVALAQHGIGNAVATLGTATTAEHLERLFRTVSEVVFCFDGDRAGRQAGWRALEAALPALREGRQARFLFLPEGEDPDSLVRAEGPEAFRARAEKAVPLSEFLFEEIAAQVDTGSVGGRARLTERALPLLARMPEGSHKTLIIERLMHMTGLSAERIEESLRTPPARTARPGAGPERRPPPSLVRQAVALLVQHPRLAALAPPPARLQGLDLAGISLLIQILELLQREPNLTTSALLERWRDHEAAPHLARLAGWDLHLPEEAMEAHFESTMARLEQKLLEQHTERLLEKERRQGLDGEERRELARLLASRQTPAQMERQ